LSTTSFPLLSEIAEAGAEMVEHHFKPGPERRTEKPNVPFEHHRPSAVKLLRQMSRGCTVELAQNGADLVTGEQTLVDLARPGEASLCLPHHAKCDPSKWVLRIGLKLCYLLFQPSKHGHWLWQLAAPERLIEDLQPAIHRVTIHPVEPKRRSTVHD
jgi:hypothetical protein